MKHATPWYLALLILLLSAVVASAVSTNDTCAAIQSEQSIAACTLLLASDQLAIADQIRLLVFRGTAYRRKADYDHAISDFSRVIEFSNKAATPELLASIYSVRAGIYLIKGDSEKALADYRAALALNPSNEQVSEGIRRSEAALASPALPLPEASTTPEPSSPTPQETTAAKVREPDKQSSTATAPTKWINRARPRVFYEEPPFGVGVLRLGQKAYVDDKTCPDGEIKEITGGDRKKGISRQHRCVARGPQVQIALRSTANQKGVAGALSREPDGRNLHVGRRVLVDDGYCPPGQIKEVIGGNMNNMNVPQDQRVRRQRKCIARN